MNFGPDDAENKLYYFYMWDGRQRLMLSITRKKLESVVLATGKYEDKQVAYTVVCCGREVTRHTGIAEVREGDDPSVNYMFNRQGELVAITFLDRFISASDIREFYALYQDEVTKDGGWEKLIREKE